MNHEQKTILSLKVYSDLNRILMVAWQSVNNVFYNQLEQKDFCSIVLFDGYSPAGYHHYFVFRLSGPDIHGSMAGFSYHNCFISDGFFYSLLFAVKNFQDGYFTDLADYVTHFYEDLNSRLYSTNI